MQSQMFRFAKMTVGRVHRTANLAVRGEGRPGEASLRAIAAMARQTFHEEVGAWFANGVEIWVAGAGEVTLESALGLSVAPRRSLRDRRDAMIRDYAEEFHSDLSMAAQARAIAHDLLYPTRPEVALFRRADARVALAAIRAVVTRIPGAGQVRNILRGVRTPGKGC
jgi:hypothetical protein